MAQVFVKRQPKVEQEGSDVVMTFECVNEENADRLVRSVVYGAVRGSIRFSLKVQEED